MTGISVFIMPNELSYNEELAKSQLERNKHWWDEVEEMFRKYFKKLEEDAEEA